MRRVIRKKQRGPGEEVGGVGLDEQSVCGYCKQSCSGRWTVQLATVKGKIGSKGGQFLNKLQWSTVGLEMIAPGGKRCGAQEVHEGAGCFQGMKASGKVVFSRKV